MKGVVSSQVTALELRDDMPGVQISLSVVRRDPRRFCSSPVRFTP